MSRLEQASFATGENAVLICLSVVSSVQCCIVISGSAVPVFTIFISHSPGLRTGKSSARAPDAGSAASRADPRQNETNCCFMLPRSRELVQQDARSVIGAQRGAIRHPAAGKRNVAAVTGVDRGEFHPL